MSVMMSNNLRKNAGQDTVSAGKRGTRLASRALVRCLSYFVDTTLVTEWLARAARDQLRLTGQKIYIDTVLRIGDVKRERNFRAEVQIAGCDTGGTSLRAREV